MADEIDRQYSPSQWCIRMDITRVVDQHIKVLRQGTAACKLKWPEKQLECNVSYWPKYPNATVDIYRPNDGESDKVLLYIHGGYWTALSKDESGWFSEVMKGAGITLIALNYDLCPSVQICTIVEQVRQSIIWLRQKYPGATISLCGHSAGAHLCAMAILTNWRQNFGLEENPISNCFMVSGIYDLQPIQKSCVNEPLQLSDDDILSMSPMHILRDHKLTLKLGKCFIIAAENDSPEFRRQSREFASRLTHFGINVEQWEVDTVDHFDVIEKLSDADYVLTRRILECF